MFAGCIILKYSNFEELSNNATAYSELKSNLSASNFTGSCFNCIFGIIIVPSIGVDLSISKD